MKELEKTYNQSADIEERLYQKWLDSKYFHAEVNKNKKPFTIVINRRPILPDSSIWAMLSIIRCRIF